jgi:hypothetical protein
VLREDEEAAQAEVTIAQEKVLLLEAEVAELTEQRNEVKEQYDIAREQHRLGLLPQIQQLQEVGFSHHFAAVPVLHAIVGTYIPVKVQLYDQMIANPASTASIVRITDKVVCVWL